MCSVNQAIAWGNNHWTNMQMLNAVVRPITGIHEEIINKYNLRAMAVDGWFYIEIRKGMYGLKQEGLLANQLLQKRLADVGYYPARHTSVIWLHKTRPILCSLIVDDFTVKYVGK
jgi:hypothetical protein